MCSHFILENKCLKSLEFLKNKILEKKQKEEEKEKKSQYLQRYHKWLSHAKEMTLVLSPFYFGLNIDQYYSFFPCQIKP